MLSASDRLESRLVLKVETMKKLLLALAFLPLAWAMPVHAVPQFTYSFGASGFAPFDEFGEPSPIDALPGGSNLVYEAATANSPIEGVASIDLEIDGHTYNTGELSFAIVNGRQRVGGNLSGVGGNSVAPGTNAFLMEWDPATLVLEAFRFSTVNREADFYVASVLTSGSIPEPATLALVVLAMSLMAIFAGRRRGVGRSASVLSRWYRPAVS
jgi:hypothetical protein